MVLDWDPAKQARCYDERGLDFADAEIVFEGNTFDVTDNRRTYAEARMITFGFLHGRMVVVVWIPQGETRRIISMRKANAKEIRKFGPRFE